ncbi:histone deacetylase domain protein [Leptospira weilii str. LNT 1234]|nr:histone deacetylase domain protein [Leptospira weilii str. LNT 1234]
MDTFLFTLFAFLTLFQGRLTKIVLESADKICGGKVLSFLEGGYNLTALSESVEAHVAVFNFFS